MAYEQKMRELAQFAKRLGESLQWQVSKVEEDLLYPEGNEDLWAAAQLPLSWALVASAQIQAGVTLIELKRFDEGANALQGAADALDRFESASDTEELTAALGKLRLTAAEVAWSVGTVLSRHALHQRVRDEAPHI